MDVKKTLECGASAMTVSVIVLASLAAIAAGIAGVVWLFTQLPAWVVEWIAHALLGGIKLAALFVAGWVIYQLCRLVVWVFSGRMSVWVADKKADHAREATLKAERKARLAAQAAANPPEPQKPIWQKVREGLANTWQELAHNPDKRKGVILAVAYIMLNVLLFWINAKLLYSVWPVDSKGNPNSVGELLKACLILQIPVAYIGGGIWNILDKRFLPTKPQRFFALLAMLHVPFLGFSLCAASGYYGSWQPFAVWAAGIMLVAGVLGAVFKCEENLFDMLRDKKAEAA